MQHKFAMNKALEQKLFGPMEESHTKEQSPQAVLREVLWARRSKITATGAGTCAWVGFSCLCEAEEEDGCRNKWRRATVGPRGREHAQGGRVRPPPSWPGGSSPHGNFCIVNSQIFPKNHIKLAWHSEDFYFRIFLYCMDKSGNRQKNTILLYFY